MRVGQVQTEAGAWSTTYCRAYLHRAENGRKVLPAKCKLLIGKGRNFARFTTIGAENVGSA